MKIPLHKAKEMNEEYGLEACLYIEDEDDVIPKGCSYSGSDIMSHLKGQCFHCDYERVIKGCSYSGSDIMSHLKGQCFHCDYERVIKEEEEKNLYWLDKTEAWDYYDYWHNKYGDEF